MPIEIPWSFEKQFPLLSKWLDLELTWAYRLPEKVQRGKVPRGELYPLTRYKALFALVQVVDPMLGFQLKELARLLNVSYDAIRHWVKEPRVKDKTREYAQKFIDQWFMPELVTVIMALEMDGSEDAPPVRPWELSKLRQEAAHFGGLIQELFFEALIQAIKTSSINWGRTFKLIEFVDSLRRLLWIIKPDTSIHGLDRLYGVAFEATKNELESRFDYFENHISTDPKEAVRNAQDLKSDVFLIVGRLDSFELSHYEVARKGKKQGKSGTKGGLENPVDKREDEKGNRSE